MSIRERYQLFVSINKLIKHLFEYQIVLQDCNVFETLAIAGELGIEELVESCEEHIKHTISVHNACTFLSTAIKLEARIPGLIYILEVMNCN